MKFGGGCRCAGGEGRGMWEEVGKGGSEVACAYLERCEGWRVGMGGCETGILHRSRR